MNFLVEFGTIIVFVVFVTVPMIEALVTGPFIDKLRFHPDGFDPFINHGSQSIVVFSLGPDFSIVLCEFWITFKELFECQSFKFIDGVILRRYHGRIIEFLASARVCNIKQTFAWSLGAIGDSNTLEVMKICGHQRQIGSRVEPSKQNI